jgi:hypothetical protein
LANQFGFAVICVRHERADTRLHIDFVSSRGSGLGFRRLPVYNISGSGAFGFGFKNTVILPAMLPARSDAVTALWLTPLTP